MSDGEAAATDTGRRHWSEPDDGGVDPSTTRPHNSLCGYVSNMPLREILRSGRLQYVTLWTLAAVCVGFALVDAGVLGFDPATLAIIAAVFAASTAAYTERSGCKVDT
jgi:hypothetical protein